ncbi:MAG TPA: methyl-accepting chemotaxis protein [Rhodocyclaceae bacterium]|jgi:methyl-accepting chemotaxis protein|nr:methyl-accepting chemotaxis protein [Rhodocyclaceae bacterium]
MTIAQRTLLLIVSATIAIFGISLLSFYESGHIYSVANRANVQVIPKLTALDKVILEFGRLRIRSYRYALNTDPAVSDDLTQKIALAQSEINGAINTYTDLADDEEEKAFINDVRSRYASYQKGLQDILSAAKKDDKSTAAITLMADSPVAEALNKTLADHMAKLTALSIADANTAAQTKDRLTRNAIIICVITLIAIALQGHMTVRVLRARIDLANAVAERIASGNLQRIQHGEASKDEVGHLLVSLDKMRNDLSETLRRISHEADEVMSSATALSTITQQVSSSTENQSNSTVAAAAAVEQLTVSIDHVGINAADANEKAKEAGASALDSVDGVSNATDQVTVVSNRIHETANQIEALSRRVRDIDNITLVIKEVAEQTNLLALNAAIEAARAGEQGRGFAVVADEVRKLAERTTHSVAEIGQLIQTIHAESHAAVDSMNESREAVSEVVSSANAANASMSQIRVSTDTVQDSINNISLALQEQRIASGELARNVEAIAQMSEQNTAAANSVASTTKHLAEISRVLRQSVMQFQF